MYFNFFLFFFPTKYFVVSARTELHFQQSSWHVGLKKHSPKFAWALAAVPVESLTDSMVRLRLVKAEREEGSAAPHRAPTPSRRYPLELGAELKPPGALPAGLSRPEEPASRWTPPTAIGLQGARSKAAIGSRIVGLGVIGRREMAGFSPCGGEVRVAMLAGLRQPRCRLLPGGARRGPGRCGESAGSLLLTNGALGGKCRWLRVFRGPRCRAPVEEEAPVRGIVSDALASLTKQETRELWGDSKGCRVGRCIRVLETSVEKNHPVYIVSALLRRVKMTCTFSYLYRSRPLVLIGISLCLVLYNLWDGETKTAHGRSLDTHQHTKHQNIVLYINSI